MTSRQHCPHFQEPSTSISIPREIWTYLNIESLRHFVSYMFLRVYLKWLIADSRCDASLQLSRHASPETLTSLPNGASFWLTHEPLFTREGFVGLSCCLALVASVQISCGLRAFASKVAGLRWKQIKSRVVVLSTLVVCGIFLPNFRNGKLNPGSISR